METIKIMKHMIQLGLCAFLLAMSTSSSGQKLDNFQFGDLLITSGDTIRLVHGSLGTTYSNVFINNSKVTRIGSQFDGAVLIVKELRSEKINKKKVVTASLGGMDPFKVKCYLKEALESGEVKINKKVIR